jgi:hypothetical protein
MFEHGPLYIDLKLNQFATRWHMPEVDVFLHTKVLPCRILKLRAKFVSNRCLEGTTIIYCVKHRFWLGVCVRAYVCVCEKERERVCVCVCERERVSV